MRRRFWVAITAAVAGLVSPMALPAAASTVTTNTPISVETSWVGNSFGNASGQEAVQPGIQGLWVASDGTAYGEQIWNEAARELMGYKNGKTFGNYTFQHESDLPNGGVAVTGDSNYVYAAVHFGNTAGIVRYNHQLYAAPFTGGTTPVDDKGSGAAGAVLVVNPSYEFLSALATGNGNLYVADPESYVSQTDTSPPENSVVKVYNTANLGAGMVSSFAAPRARGLAVDGDGDIWVLEQGDKTNSPMVVRYTPEGVPTGQAITNLSDPTAIAIDTSAGGVGRLLITDAGPSDQIKIATGLDTTPAITSTFGVAGGINAGPVPGTVGPLRFNGPNAVGVDASGNIYVSNDGTPSFAVGNYGQGNSLEAYKPDGTELWSVYGQKYSTTGSVDPSTGTDVYTDFDHYSLDLSKPAGQQWTRVGWTLNQTKYPWDPRVNGQNQGQNPSNPDERTLDGQKFLFMGNGMSDAINIFRFAPPSQTAIPSGSINTYQGKGSPAPGEFIWRDTNGDGTPYGNVANEYFQPKNPQNIDASGWYVDSAGDVWQTIRSGSIREFPFGGLDSQGNPIYSYATMRTFATPAPFTDPRRLFYDPATDTLILSGYTTANPTPSWVEGDYKFSGSTLAAYKNFTSSATPTQAWSVVVPYTMTSSDTAHKPITLTVAGDYAFVGYFTGADNQENSDIHVFKISDGSPMGVITPGTEVGSAMGNTDMEDGTDAYEEPNGQYLILNEDDEYDKTIMYEWTPPGTTLASPTATPTPSATPTATPTPAATSTAPTSSATPTPTPTVAPSTPTATPTSTPTASSTPTPTATPPPTVTPTPTPTVTSTPTPTPTVTSTPTPTPSVTSTPLEAPTPSVTPTPSDSASVPTGTPTVTSTPTPAPTPSPTLSSTPTGPAPSDKMVVKMAKGRDQHFRTSSEARAGLTGHDRHSHRSASARARRMRRAHSARVAHSKGAVVMALRLLDSVL